MRIIEETFIQGEPKAQPRVKATIRGRHAGVYTPRTADAWKAKIKQELKDFHGLNYEYAVSLRVVFHMPRPKSHFRVIKGETSEEIKAQFRNLAHTKKPDLDNLVKSVKDAMTDCGVWKDDSQVTRLWTEKVYAPSSRFMGITLTVSKA